MLKEITAVISDGNANIRTVETHPGDAGDALIEFVIDAEDVRHLNLLVQGLRRLPGVRDVQRSQKL
jgi:GTP pyrophosphokinase